MTSQGRVVRIFRSEDGQNWDLNFPDSTCTVNVTGTCTFSTNHFSYFGAIDSTASIVTNSSTSTITGPGGGGGYYYPITTENTTPFIPASGVIQEVLTTQPLVLSYSGKTQYPSAFIQYIETQFAQSPQPKPVTVASSIFQEVSKK
jgi:hypothetical protein